MTFGIAVSDAHVQFLIDGKLVAERDYDPEDLQGRIGVVLQGAKASFSDLRVRY